MFKTNRTFLTLAVLAMAVLCFPPLMADASTISFVDSDVSTNAAWRTSSVAKPLDADGDNIYGTDGYYAARSWITSSLPTYATVGVNSGSTHIDNRYVYLDNAAGTAITRTAVNYNGNAGTGTEQDFYTVTLTAAADFRLGIITDNADMHWVSPSDLRVRQTVGGTETTALIATSDRDIDGDYYFFDISGATGDVFVVSGVSIHSSSVAYSSSNGLGGLTFDTVPEPATMSMLVLGGLGVLLKRRRRRA